MTPRLCPFCLSEVIFQVGHAKALSDDSEEGLDLSRAEKAGPGVCRCPTCNSEIPAMYVKGYEKYPPIVASAVGFSGHGKSVYFASLLHELRSDRLPSVWNRFHSLALDDESLVKVLSNMNQLREGCLPEATPKNFERPTLLRLSGVPLLGNSTLCLYDVSGEAFESGAGIGRYARYVSRARSVLFLLSLSNLGEYGSSAGDALLNLMNAYVLGVNNALQGDTSDQHLVVVYTKADALFTSHLAKHPDLQQYVSSNPLEGLAEPKEYLEQVYRTSQELRNLTAQDLNAYHFLNFALDSFASVDFTLVSALGAQPDDERHLSTRIAPRRVLDPLLLLLQKGGAVTPAELVSASCSPPPVPDPTELQTASDLAPVEFVRNWLSEFEWTPMHTWVAAIAAVVVPLLLLMMMLLVFSGRKPAKDRGIPIAELGHRAALQGELGVRLNMEPVQRAFERRNVATQNAGQALFLRDAGPHGGNAWIFPSGRIVVANSINLADLENFHRLMHVWNDIGQTIAKITANVKTAEVTELLQTSSEIYTQDPDQLQSLTFQNLTAVKDWRLNWPDAHASWALLTTRGSGRRSAREKIFIGEQERVSMQNADLQEVPLFDLHFGDYPVSIEASLARVPFVQIAAFFHQPQGQITMYDGSSRPVRAREVLSKPLRALYVPMPAEYSPAADPREEWPRD